MDVSRNYYADLELTPDASTDDIKRQFRKLALTYHPDRNPGREAEVRARFVEVNNAHEVLGNPALKEKYDQARRRGNVNTGNFARPPPPRRRDPFPSSNFPPPPRHANHPANANANAGASRYTNNAFNPPPPPRHTQSSSKQDANARQNMFQAWQNMNHNQKPSSSSSSSSSRQQRHNLPPQYNDSARFKPGASSNEPGPSRSAGAGEGTPPRSAWDELNRRQKRNEPSRPAPRRPGQFDPSAPGVDDPAATNTSHYNAIPRYDRSDVESSPHPSPRAPTARKSESSRSGANDQVPFTEGSRERTPYVAKPLERMFTVDPQRNPEGRRPRPYRGPSLDESRPSSHPSTRPSSVSPSSTAPQADGSDIASPDPTRLRHARARSSGMRSEHTFDADKIVVSYSSSDESSNEGDDGNAHGNADSPDGRPRGQPGSSDISTSSDEPSFEGSESGHRPRAEPSGAWSKRRSESDRMSKPRSLDERKRWQEQNGAPRGPDRPGSAVYSYPHPHDRDGTPQQSPGPKASPLSPLSGERRASHPENRVKAESLPRTESQPSLSQYNTETRAPPDKPKSAGGQANEQDTHSSFFSSRPPGASHSNERTFSAEEWTDDLKSNNWAEKWAQQPPNSASGRASPTRSGRPRAYSSRERQPYSTTSIPQQPSVADEIEEEEGRHHWKHNGSRTSSRSRNSDVMDIDPPGVDIGTASGEAGGVDGSSDNSGARQVYVEPQRAEWRERAPSSSNSKNDAAPEVPPKIPNQPLSMSDFKHVTPLNMETSGGISNMKDLSSTLPFESKASNEHPSRTSLNEPSSAASASSPGPGAAGAASISGDGIHPSTRVPVLELPRPPRAPLPPSKLTYKSWAYYVGQMSAYISAWNTFNARMVANLQDLAVRLAEMEKGEAAGMVDGWIGAVGETRELGGWNTYVRVLDAEDRVHAHWTVACEKHRAAVRAHTKLREQALEEKL